MTGRAVPYHCPFCAEENLRPHGERHGDWECRSCLRAFGLKFIGHLSRVAAATTEPPDNPTPDNPAPNNTQRRTAS